MDEFLEIIADIIVDVLRPINRYARTTYGIRFALKILGPYEFPKTDWAMDGLHASKFFTPASGRNSYAFDPSSLYAFAASRNHLAAMTNMLQHATPEQVLVAVCMAAPTWHDPQYKERNKILEQSYKKHPTALQCQILKKAVMDWRLDLAKNLCQIFDLPVLQETLKELNTYPFGFNLEAMIPMVPDGLIYAIENGLNPQVVCRILSQEFQDKSPYLYRIDAQGNTPLHYAVQHPGNVETVKTVIKLLPGEGTAYIRNKKGETPLMLAQPKNRRAILEATTSDNNIYLADNAGNNALHRAIRMGDVEAVEDICLCTKNPSNFLRKDLDGDTAFHLVAAYLHMIAEERDQILGLMLQCFTASDGVFQPNDLGKTPLHYAAAGNYPSLVATFLSLTADQSVIYKPDKDGKTALMLASENRRFAAIHAIVAATKDDTHIFAPGNIDKDGNNILHHAVLNNDTETVKGVLARLSNPEHLLRRNRNGQNVLHLLAANPYHQAAAEIADLILARVEDKQELLRGDHEWRTPIYLAAETGNEEILKKLLGYANNEEWAYHPAKNGTTPLIMAAYNKKVNAVRVLLDATQDEANIYRHDSYGVTALHFAADQRQPQIVRLILARTKRPENIYKRVSNDGTTALSIAVKNGDRVTVGMILQQTNQSHYLHMGKNNQPPLELAANRGQKQIAAMIRGRMDEISTGIWSPLPAPAPEHTSQDTTVPQISLREIDALKDLIKNGADINVRDQNGWSALELAARDGYIRIVREFIKAGANINNQDASGWTPLMYAAHHGRTEIVEELIKAQANVQLRLKDGWTVLMLAASKGHLESVKQLIKAGANLECVTKYGSTAFMIAAANDRLDVLRELATAGANIHATKPNKESAIHLAAYNGSMNCMKELLDMGFDIESKDNSGCTPLMEAARGDKPHMVEYLIKCGANVSAQCYKDRTPIMYAVKGRSKTCVDILYKYSADIDGVDYKGETPQSLAVKARVPEIAAGWAIDGKISAQSTFNFFGLGFYENGMVPDRQITMNEFRNRLNNTLFLAVHQKDIRTIYSALNSGANPLAPCFMGHVSPLGLAVHLDDPAVLRLILNHMQKTMSAEEIEQAKQKSQAGIKNYYAVTGATIANSCTTKRGDRVDLAASLAARLEKGQFINVELRKTLYQKTKDKKFVTSHDAFDLELRLDAKLVEGINSGKARLSFPALNYALISEQEVWQIFQELVIMNMLQQRISLSLPQDPVFNTGIYVELTESLHDTLVGTVVTETDRIMKEYVTNSIYLPPEIRKKFDWRKQLQTTDTDWPKLDNDDAVNIARVEQIYLAHGGVDLSKLDGVEPLTYQALVEAEYAANGVINVPTSAICLDNVGASLTYSGRNICARDKVNIFEWGRWQIRNEEEVKPYRTQDWVSTNHLVNTLRRIPLFAKQFALLEAVYTLAPVAQAMVMSGNIPDFKKLPKMQPYETEKTQPPIIVRRPNTLLDTYRTPAEMRRALEQAHESGDYENVSYSVFGGCVHNHGFASTELSAKEFEKEKARLSEESRSRRGGGNGGNGDDGNGGNNGGDGNNPEKLIQQIIETKRQELLRLKVQAETTQKEAQAAQDKSREHQETARLRLIEKHLAALQDEERIRAAWERSDAIKAVEEAKKHQIDGGYDIDDHKLIFMPKGSIIWGRTGVNKEGNKTSELGDSPFYTNTDTLLNSHGLADVYFEQLQVRPHDELKYRDYVRAYVLDKDMFIPACVCEKNPGNNNEHPGGGQQFYVAKYPAVLKEFGSLIGLYDRTKQRGK